MSPFFKGKIQPKTPYHCCKRKKVCLWGIFYFLGAYISFIHRYKLISHPWDVSLFLFFKGLVFWILQSLFTHSTYNEIVLFFRPQPPQLLRLLKPFLLARHMHRWVVTNMSDKHVAAVCTFNGGADISWSTDIKDGPSHSGGASREQPLSQMNVIC